MKKLLLFIFILSYQFVSAQNRVVQYQLIHHYTIAEINSILGATGASTFFSPSFEVDYYRVIYNTSNALGNGSTTASGALAVPTGVSCPMPLFSYQHGTQTIKTSVPSNRAGDEFKVGLIACSSKGAIVCMPDYLGLGSSSGFHPYINARTEASATIDLLRSAKELTDSIGFNLNQQLFLFGYSQGAHATMATFKEIETNLSSEFTVTACAPMSGPYNVSGIQAETIVKDTSYATPAYLPYVIMGQQAAYGNLYNNLSDIFIHPYDSLLPLYFNGIRSTGYINNRLPDTPNLILDPVLLDDFKNDPNHFFRNILRDNDLHNWRPTAPLHMYYCTQDEQVFYQNSLIARDTMHALGATHVNAINVGAFTHSGCAQLCFVQGFFFFNSFADFSGGITVTDSTTAATSSGLNDGQIQIFTNNAVGNLNYNWLSTGLADSTSLQTQLAAGSYQISVSDSRGCYVIHNSTVGTASSIHEEEAESFSIGPNPMQSFLEVQIPQHIAEKSYHLTVTDPLGRIIVFLPNQNNAILQLDLTTLNVGQYQLGIESGRYRKYKGFQKI